MVSLIFNFNEVVKLGNAIKSTTTDVNELVSMTNKMSLEQSLAVLSTKKLSEEEKRLILIENGLISVENNKTVAMNASTSALSAYTAGLKANAKAWLVSIAKNPVTWITAVGVAVYGVVKAIEYFNSALDRQKKKLEEARKSFDDAKNNLESVNNELKTAKNRMQELQSMGSLSFVESEELEKLKDTVEELTIAADVADRLKKREAKELSEENKETYNAEFGKFDSYNTSENVKAVYDDMKSNGGIHLLDYSDGNLSNQLGLLMYLKDELKKVKDEYNNAVLNNDALSEEELLLTIENLEDNISDTEKALENSLDTLEQYRQNAEDAEDTTSEYYNSILKDRKLIYEYLDSAKWNTTEFESIFNTHGIEKTKSELVSMYEAGELNPETITQYKNLNKALLESDFILGENEKAIDLFIQQIASMANEASKAAPEVDDLLSITDTVDNINKKLKPALDSLAGIYTTLFDKENGYEWQIIDVEEFASIKSELDSLKEEFGIDVPVEDYEEFVKILSNTETTSEQAQQAFDDLATSMINNSNVVELTDENFDVLRNSLENLGVTNANEVLEKIRDAEAKLIDEGINLENVNLDLAQSFIEEAGAADVASQYLQMHMLKKHIDNANPLNTYNSVEALEKECKALKITGDLLDKTAKLKSLFYAAERNLGTPNVLDEIKKTQSEINDLINNQYSYEFNFEFDGNTTGDNKDKSSSKDTKETFDWIETLISRIQRNITNLGKVVSATYRNWSTRNNALAQEMGEVNKEINAQMTAYNAYMQKANSVPLAEGYKELVRSGAYKISEITDEKLKEQIQEYEEWYNKALDASDAIEDLRANLAELAKTKFDNISAQYDEQISLITHNVSMLEGFVSQSEAAGYMASEVYYKAMAEKQQENIAQLQREYSSLLSAFDEAVKSGSIQKYSSDWYEMLSAINDVELEIQSATTELIEFNQTLQQLSWEVFDKIQNSVSGIIEEANFLIDVLDSKDLHTDKGVITDEGLAVQGLHAVNYNTYMEQALAYADEMAKIEAEMAKDPYDMELVERRNELLGLQQEAISNAMSEKEAIRDLVSDGYDKMLNSLDELINKRKEALQAEKDMYDYQNSISEKTNNIANLKKQLQAYSGDNSESAKATIQKLQLSLSEAEKDLQQTEYEKYLSDQEQMLDTLYDQTEQWVNERLDNIDGLISEVVDATNRNAETISNAIHDLSNNYGYKISDTMETIWDYEENAIDGVATIVSVYGDILSGSNQDIVNNITNGTTNVVNAISGLNSSMQSMIGELRNIATANANSIAQAQNAVVNQQNNSYPTNNSAGNVTVSSSASTSSSNNGSTGGTSQKKEETKTPKGYYAYIGDEKIGNKYGYANEGMAQYAAEVEVERRAKAASNGISGSPGVQIYNNTKSALTRQIRKVPFYAKGTSNAPKGLGIFGEDGKEILIANDGSIMLSSGATLYPFQGGETVLNAKETAETLSNSLTPLSINDFSKIAPNMSGVVRNTNGNVNQDINVSFALPNVTDANSLITELQNNKRFEKVIQGMTADVMIGKNSLSKYKF